jgi:hypothetical protein
MGLHPVHSTPDEISVLPGQDRQAAEEMHLFFISFFTRPGQSTGPFC